ncbi:NACHT domain-containing protein [Actinosynnema sp. NPDC050801]|uniref:NACHT domain-containing protein n=1 Tax=unclassified Actinosynnema TaxID=2637065 RepID=UPI0033DF2989
MPGVLPCPNLSAWGREDTIAILEAAAGKLGGAVAQHAAKSWLERRRKSGDRTASLAALAAQELSSLRQRARLDHLIEGIGHQVGDQLEPLLAAKFAALPEHEITAALDAVVDALGSLDLSDEALLAADAEPELLARRVRATLVRDAGLSERATRLYEVALDQACRYLVQVIRHLPAFQPRALAEVLGRASQQTALLDEVLARLPRTSLHAPTGVDTDEEFRDEYLRYVAAGLDRLELLGLTMRHRPKLALSVAYLSLSVTDGDRRAAERGADRWFGGDVEGGGSLRVEAAIGGADRTLVRGEAGSGKTTLLDWLAVTAAREAFTDRLAAWNGSVPLVVRLRRYADSPLPRPEQFLDHEAGWLAGLMPTGWVHRVLRSGRALVLVDGVDEVPAGRRRLVKVWLRELVTAFPRARVVVTSRPAAADRRWLADEGFGSVLLDRMSPDDVRVFLRRWHEAARDAESLPCPPEDLPEAERRLLRQLGNRPHLRALTASPLLCAMLCALNLGRTSELPQSRMELYRAALTMLLDLRDAERQIAGILTGAEKTVLLRDLAWRLTQANRSEFPITRATEFVSHKLRSVPGVDLGADAVLAHLLERSGVLREPVPGRVDFVHRTFQEYLAASEATELEHVETLAGNAHLDTWRETIVMACGHGKRSQTRALLTQILDRADEEPRHARHLRLLAAACLETVTEVDPEVHARIEAVIRERLAPPRSIKETRSLASLGSRVLRYLPDTLDGLSDSAAAATTRAVALTGSAEAIPRLARYAQDGRQGVQTEVVRAWDYFDPERYAHEVLAHAPLDDGLLEVESHRFLPHVAALRNVKEVAVRLTLGDVHHDLHFIEGVPHLAEFWVWLRGTVDLRPLVKHPSLRHLALLDAGGYDHVEVLRDLPNLRGLHWYEQAGTRDLGFLRHVPDLVDLSFDRVDAAADVDLISELRSLRDVSFNGWPDGVSLAPLGKLPELHRVRFGWDTSPAVLDGIERHLPGLRRLILVGDMVDNLDAVTRLSHLESVYLSRWQDADPIDLRPLRDMSVTVELARRSNPIGMEELGPNVTVRRYR